MIPEPQMPSTPSFYIGGCSCYFAVFILLFFLLLGCKLLYKHDLTKRWGNHCKMCSYCLQTSPKLVQNLFGAKMEEFCSEECMSKFTVLFYQVNLNFIFSEIQSML